MLCRKQITFEVLNDNILDYNYQYSLMKILYNALTITDKTKALMLHNEGFKIDNKRFKLMNYTLLFENFKMSLEGVILTTKSTVKLLLNGKEDLVNDIVKGLLKIKEFKIFDCSLRMINMEKDRPVKFNKTMLYKVHSAVVESKWSEQGQVYYTPYQMEFYNAISQNLNRKYELVYGKKYTGDFVYDIENILSVKEKKINKIKNNGQVIGYGHFNIWIQAEPDMQKIAYYCGLGQNSSIGAGCIGYITGR